MQSADPVKEAPEETPQVEEPAPEKKKESKRPKKKNKRDKPKRGDKETENTENGTKKNERPQRQPRVRKHVYQEEENWREKLAEEVTLETKVPAKRKKEDLMKRPERDEMNKKLEKKNLLVRKKRKEIEELFKQKDKIREEEMRKQNEGYTAFLTLKKEKDDAWEKVEALRAELKFNSLRDKQNKWRERMRQMMDKSPFKGIAKNMEQAKRHIEKLDMEFRDKKKTAKEEKLMTDSIRKFKKGLGHFEKVDALQKKMDANWDLFKAARERLKPLEEELKKAKGKLKKSNDEYKRKKELEKEEEGKKAPENEGKEEKKKERKERVLTPGEEEIMKKVRKIREDIKKIHKEKDEIFDDFDKQMVEYRKDHFEYARENYINKLVNDLKREERQRKWEENKAKREEERQERLKDARKEIFTAELEKVNSVNGALQLLKLDRDRAELFKEGKEPVEGSGNVEQIDYEAENLELVVSKKKPHVAPVSKKRRNKKKRKEKVNLAMVMSKKKTNSLVPPDIAVILAEMGVEAPKELAQVDDTIKAVSAKRDEYLKLRERYVNEEKFEGEEANIVNKAEMLMNRGKDWEAKEGEEGEVREQKVEKGKPKRGKKKPKKLVENEDEFPSL